VSKAKQNNQKVYRPCKGRDRGQQAESCDRLLPVAPNHRFRRILGLVGSGDKPFPENPKGSIVIPLLLVVFEHAKK